MDIHTKTDTWGNTRGKRCEKNPQTDIWIGIQIYGWIGIQTDGWIAMDRYRQTYGWICIQTYLWMGTHRHMDGQTDRRTVRYLRGVCVG